MPTIRHKPRDIDTTSERSLPIQKSLNLSCNFRDELHADRPSTDESQSLDCSQWPTCSIASSTSGTRPARKVKLCCPSETECTIICLAYSRTDVSLIWKLRKLSFISIVP